MNRSQSSCIVGNKGTIYFFYFFYKEENARSESQIILFNGFQWLINEIGIDFN